MRFAEAAAARVRARIADMHAVHWPVIAWQHDPVGFCATVLGMVLTAEQAVIARAVATSPRVAVAAGRKIGKSELAAALAIWYYCSFPGATVRLIAPTEDRLRDVMWPAIRRLCHGARIPVGEPATRVATGMTSADFPERTIRGSSARVAENMQGTAGNIFYVVDEASGVADFVYETLEGNQAGGGASKTLAVANPTRAAGYFFECFEGRRFAKFWRTFRLSSLTSPNIRTGQDDAVPHLATLEWAERELAQYGADSPLYRIHVLGEFCLNEAGRVINAEVLQEAQARWPDAPAEGVLHIGVDPAGPGVTGDATVFAVRRGAKCLALRAYRGLDAQALWETLRATLHEFRGVDLTPVVVLDAGGAVGEPLAVKLKGIANTAKGHHGFALVCVRANKPAQREPQRFGYVRDELWANLSRWLHDGGAVPPDDDALAGELTHPLWRQDHRGLARVEDKDATRKALGRSPDRADALALAVWPSARQLDVALERAPQGAEPPDEHFPEATFDPYGSGDWAHR